MAKQRFKAPNYGQPFGVVHHIFSFDTGKKDKDGKAIRKNLIFHNAVYTTEDPKEIAALMDAGYLPVVLSEEELAEAGDQASLVDGLVEKARSLGGKSKKVFFKGLEKAGITSGEASEEEDVSEE